METKELTRSSLRQDDHNNSRLNTKFRCDCKGCGSQAYVEVIIERNGLPLYFCGHHAKVHEEALLSVASEWYDELARLNENRKKGSEN